MHSQHSLAFQFPVIGGIALMVFLGTCTGCLQDPGGSTEKTENAQPPAEKSSASGIIGKTTRDIGLFDPDSGSEEADLAVDPNSGYLGATTGAYKYAVGQTSKLKIQHALQLYQATTGEFPKDLDEFMAKIIEPNQIDLPVLPGRLRYEYDVANHELKVVKEKK